VLVAKMMINNKCCEIYTAGAAAKDFSEGMQYIDDRHEQLEQFGIALPEFVKLSGLFSG
jgi:hypothetical protein